MKDASPEHIFYKFRREFAWVRDGFLTAIYDQEPIGLTPIGRMMHFYIKHHLKNELPKLKQIEQEDIEGQLYLIWFELIHNWKKNRPPVYIKSYLLRMAPWTMRDWLKKEAKARKEKRVSPENIDCTNQDEVEFDAAFVVHDTDIYPYSTLTKYDRLLLHMHFYEDLSVTEMAERLQKYRSTVKRDLDDLLTHLRSCFNESQNTRGSS